MKPVGIDLGTTYCAVAIVDGGQPEILEGDSGRLTPSAVCFDDGEPLVGTIAKNMAALRPEHYIGFVKRRMGSREPVYITDEGVEHSPEAISAIILRHLTDAAEQALGADVRDVVITVPAYFNDAARVATKDAAEIAGLNVLRLINEPTAAGIAYGLSKDATGTFLVYDLGGGTFDVTVLKVADGHIDVVATDGNRALGGFDFDNLLMQRVAADVAAQSDCDLFDEGRLEAQLRLDCEEAKRRLSQRDKAVVRTATGEQVVTTTVTRDEFEADTAELLKRTEAVIEEVLEQAGLGWDRIDRTLLVGGSSRMPMVAAMVERLSGERPRLDINPDEVVAIGAAQLAAAIEPAAGASMGLPAADPTASLVKDVTSHGMGIAAIDEQGILRNCVIIPRNSTIPCVESEEFSTVEAGQRTIDFKITEGDALELDDVEVHDISELALPPGLPDTAPLRVSMAFDVDGTIHADVFDLTNDRSLGDFHLPRPNNLSAEEKGASARLLFRGGGGSR